MAGKEKTSMQDQWVQAKAANPDALLLFRVGDFYEMFGDDAKLGAEVLGLTLTTRDKNKVDAIPLAGIPHHALDRYLTELLAAGIRVAICEQLENPKTATGVVKRGVTRVVTPGTVIDDSCLTDKKNNYLLAVNVQKNDCALALADVSTGEFLVTRSSLNSLHDDLEKFSPAEIIAPVEMLQTGKPLFFLTEKKFTTTLTKRDGYEFSPIFGQNKLLAHFQVATIDGFGIGDSPTAIGAAGAALSYLEETQKTALPHLKNIRLLPADTFMVLDYATQKNLEIFNGANPRYTLISAIDRTLTAAGGRLLRQFLARPLVTSSEIKKRQGAIMELMNDEIACRNLREELHLLADAERLLARIAAGRSGPRDLFALGITLARLPKLRALASNLNSALLVEQVEKFSPPRELAELLQSAIQENPPFTTTVGGFIRAEFNAALAELRKLAHGGKEWLKEYEKREQQRTGIPSLKVGFNQVFGYYLEITNAQRAKIPANYTRKQTLANAERCITAELKEYADKILGAEEKSAVLEQQIFAELTRKILAQTAAIQQAAEFIALLDVISALADLGHARHWVMPEITNDWLTEIIGGRHPVLDELISNFTPNDTLFNDEQRVHIITGPNMAGKSTYIRQVALLVILAQIGAPLPVERARIGIVDRVFTRVGAADNLARGQSTFMVEMIETANILRNATARSLVILDEVGRGTSTFDGVSLAWAITEELHQVAARTLFATHYHELAELGTILTAAKNFNVAAQEWQEQVIFLHKIAAGAADKSYGIQVARIAGLPRSVLARAQKLLDKFENAAEKRDVELLKEKRGGKNRQAEGSLFAEPDYADLLRSISTIEINVLTPLAAQQKLAEIIGQIRAALG